MERRPDSVALEKVPVSSPLQLRWRENFLLQGCLSVLTFISLSVPLPISRRSVSGSGCRGDYHWRELPQVSFLSRQKYCRDKHTSFVATKVCLLRQNDVCRGKYLSRQTHVCIIGGSRNKYHTCSSRQTRVCRDKTRLLSRQKYACRDECFVGTYTCLFVATKDKIMFVAIKTFGRGKHTFVATKDVCLSRQYFCRDKNDTCGSSRQ